MASEQDLAVLPLYGISSWSESARVKTIGDSDRGNLVRQIGGSVRIREDIKPVTYMRDSASELLRTVGETRRPVVITQDGEPKGVLLDVASYEELRDATLLLRLVAQGEDDVRLGRTIPQAEVFKDLRSRLAEK